MEGVGTDAGASVVRMHEGHIAIDLSTVLLLLALFGTLLGKTESMLELVRSSEDRYQARYK